MRTDEDALRDAYRFVRTEEDDRGGQAWEVGLARAYESKLFKEYALVDLSQYKKGRYGCRWRTKQEVLAGKGQASCGALGCEEARGLETFEVPFSYVEGGKEKLALVKARLCATHSLQLQYKKLKAGLKEEKRKRAKQERQQAKRDRKRRRSVQAADDAGERSASPSESEPADEQPEERSREARKQAKQSRKRRSGEAAAETLQDAGKKAAAGPAPESKGAEPDRRSREAAIQREADAFLARLG